MKYIYSVYGFARHQSSVCSANFRVGKMKTAYKLNQICTLGDYCHRIMLSSGGVF